MKDDVKLVHLLSGEDILAVVTFFGEKEITLDKPLRLMLAPPTTPNGQPQVGIMPWPMFGEEKAKVDISRDHVLYIITPTKNLIGEYIKAMSSLIMPPSSGGLKL